MASNLGYVQKYDWATDADLQYLNGITPTNLMVFKPLDDTWHETTSKMTTVDGSAAVPIPAQHRTIGGQNMITTTFGSGGVIADVDWTCGWDAETAVTGVTSGLLAADPDGFQKIVDGAAAIQAAGNVFEMQGSTSFANSISTLQLSTTTATADLNAGEFRQTCIMISTRN